MQNNFEKDVRQKMDELKLSPSAALWERVEVEIKEEKRNRRVIFWLLPIGLLLFSGGWWLYQSAQSNKEAAVEKSVNKPSAKRSVEDPTITAEKKTENKKNIGAGYPSSQVQTSITNKKANLNNKIKPSITSSDGSTKKASPKPVANVDLPNSTVNKKRTKQVATVIAKVEDTPTDDKRSKAVSIVDSTTKQNTVKITSADQTDSLKTKEETKEPLLPFNDSVTNKREEPSLPKADSVLKKKVASAKKWQKQLRFDAGLSGYAEGPLFPTFSNSWRDAFYSAPQNVVNAPVQNTVNTQPAKISSGFHFSVGVAAAKNLGRRWALSFGLQYAYASTHQKVGDKMAADTAVFFAMDKSIANGFYTNAGKSNYTNRFHFIEVPVSLSFKPSRRLPMYVSLGAAYQQLLATNALTYSSLSNLYYRNKENYLCNALSLSSSAQVEFFGKKKIALRTGPFVQYNTTKLRKENSNNVPLLLTAGLRTAITF